MPSEKNILTDSEGLSTKEALNKLKAAIKDELENEQVILLVLSFTLSVFI